MTKHLRTATCKPVTKNSHQLTQRYQRSCKNKCAFRSHAKPGDGKRASSAIEVEVSEEALLLTMGGLGGDSAGPVGSTRPHRLAKSIKTLLFIDKNKVLTSLISWKSLKSIGGVAKTTCLTDFWAFGKNRSRPWKSTLLWWEKHELSIFGHAIFYRLSRASTHEFLRFVVVIRAIPRNMQGHIKCGSSLPNIDFW